MFELAITVDAEAELEALWASDEEVAADLSVLIEELRDDQTLLDAMRIHQRREGRLHVSRWLAMRARRMDIWRLKVFELEDPRCSLPYRIIYAYDNEKRTFYILAFMHRSVDYERDRGFEGRIRNAYQNLGIPAL